MSNSINTVQITNYALLVLTNKAMTGFYTYYKDRDEINIICSEKAETKKIFGIEYYVKGDTITYKEKLKLCMDENTKYKSPIYEKIREYNIISSISRDMFTKKDEIIYHLDYDLYEKLVRIGNSYQDSY